MPSSLIERLIRQTDTLLKSLHHVSEANPSKALAECELELEEKQKISKMMRINHSGEVCAQALYQGQALFAHNPHQFNHMLSAANEEVEHLSWCKQRLVELDSRPSLLNPLWFLGSFCLGASAALCGDKISNGFLYATETQVSEHITQHLNALPDKDLKTRAILEQMLTEEQMHAQAATEKDFTALPKTVTTIMHKMAKVFKLATAKI